MPTGICQAGTVRAVFAHAVACDAARCAMVCVAGGLEQNSEVERCAMVC